MNGYRHHNNIRQPAARTSRRGAARPARRPRQRHTRTVAVRLNVAGGRGTPIFGRGPMRPPK